jgi:hypothetical protein
MKLHSNKNIPLVLLFMIGTIFMSYGQDNLSYRIPFETAKSKLPQSVMDTLINQLQTWKDYKIVLEGHTDNIGNAEYNQNLSQARVEEIQSILVENEIDTGRIVLLASGATKPIATNDTPEGRAQNRRVDILLTTKVMDETLVIEKKRALNEKLQTLMSKKGMTHRINPNREQTIVAKQGTRVTVPANAFDVPEGAKVLLKVTEVYRKSDMILNNLSTVSNGRALETGGMIKIEAFADGEAIELRDGMELDVEVPTEEVEDEMQLFASEIAEDGSVNWVQPQPLARQTVYQPPSRLDWSLDRYKMAYIPFKEAEPREPIFRRKPKKVDSTEYYRLLDRKRELEENPYKSYKRYKTVKGILGKRKVKKSNKDSIAYLDDVKRMIKSVEGKIGGQMNRIRELHADHVIYQRFLERLKEHDAWAARRDSNYLLNLPIATKHRNMHGMQRYSKALKEKEYYEYWSKIYNTPIKNSYDYNEIVMSEWGDSLLCYKAMAEKDTGAVHLMGRYKYVERLMVAIHQAETVEEAYIAHCKYRDYIKYKIRADELGITIEEAIRREQIERKWQEESSYLFRTANLGSYINCDFFPRMAPDELLVTAELEIPDSIGVTKTMMVFENYNTVMEADINSYFHKCSWRNIPLDEPVKVVSIYMDEEGQMHVAMQKLNVQRSLSALDYKPMTEVEFLRLLSGVNDIVAR